MNRLFKVIGVLLLGAALASCNYDADAELKALEEEMDRLEQEDQKIRNHFLEKINSLRGRLVDLIAQVEQELNEKIESGRRAVLKKLSEKVNTLTAKINKGFDDTRDYMDDTFSSCRDYITKSFTSLEKCQNALASQIDQARQKGEEDNLKVLLLLEKDLDRVKSGAQSVKASIDGMENQLAKAEEMKKRLERVRIASDDLDEAYSEMERKQLALMQALEDKITDEYLESLTTTQLAEVKKLVAEAESLVDSMEGFKDDISNYSIDAESYLADMEDVAAMLDDLNSDYGSVVDDLMDGLSNIEEFWEYFESSEASTWYDEIDSLADENQSLYEATMDTIDEQRDIIEAFYSASWDWYEDVQACCEEAYGHSDAAESKANEILSL